MRFLLDLPLKYKFWLVNGVSFFGMLVLSIAAVCNQLPPGASWDNFLALLWQKTPYYGVLVFVLMSLVLLASQMLIVFVSLPMQTLREAMLQVNRDGDLSVRTESRSADEVGQMADAFNAMVHDLAILVTEVRAAALTMDAMSKSLAEETNRNAGSIEIQQHEVDQLATAVNQLAHISQDIHQNADDNNRNSVESVSVARTGQQQVEFVMGSIEHLASDIRDGAGVVEQLAQETGSIGSALDVIKSIAEQTNLLALNAAIEAARAGEQGRGFAVVADEVRSLAQRVQESTEQIKTMLDQLQYSSQHAVSVMNARSDEAGQCVDQANEAGKVIHDIARNAQNITDASGEIAVSISQQTETIRNVNQNVVKLRDELEAVINSVKSNADTARTLSELSSRMARSVEHLKL